MRGLAAALCLFALPLAGADAAPRKVVSPVVLMGKGLVVRGSVLRFGTPRATAVRLVTSALGRATGAGVYPECGGDHPIAYARFGGGIELSFVGGKFVGWTTDSRRMQTANGVGIGATVRTLQRLLPDVFIDPGNDEGGGIGPNFSSDTGVNGWLDGSKVTSKVTGMYRGDTCIVE